MKRYARPRESVIEAIERAIDGRCVLRVVTKATAADTMTTERTVVTYDEALAILRHGYARVEWYICPADGPEVPL